MEVMPCAAARPRPKLCKRAERSSRASARGFAAEMPARDLRQPTRQTRSTRQCGSFHSSKTAIFLLRKRARATLVLPFHYCVNRNGQLLQRVQSSIGARRNAYAFCARRAEELVVSITLTAAGCRPAFASIQYVINPTM